MPLSSKAWWILVALATVAAAVLAVVGVSVWWLGQAERLSEEEVQRTVVSTLQAEAPASFFVTGTLDVTATTTVENTRYLFPELLRFDLGTTRARVRLPGRAAYGFDIRTLAAEDIRLDDDGTVVVRLPALMVFSVEPNLDAMEVETDVGWARTHAGSGQAATASALRFAQQALRDQAETYLASAQQPHLNTAEALERMLRPVLEAAGLEAPVFQFEVGAFEVRRPAS